jgi:hypothetical protein
LLVITSCNWTEKELLSHFSTSEFFTLTWHYIFYSYKFLWFHVLMFIADCNTECSFKNIFFIFINIVVTSNMQLKVM